MQSLTFLAATAAFMLMVTAGAARAEGAADRQIRKEVVVSAPPAEVWKAWTTPEGARTFFAPAARIELRPGGPYEIFFNPAAPAGSRGAEDCRVLSYVPGEMLSFSWNAPPQFPEVRRQRTAVIVQLAPEGTGTRVRLTQNGWGQGEQWDQVFAYFEKAWDTVLASLKTRFDSGPRKWPAELAVDPAPAPRLPQWVYLIRPAREAAVEQPTPDEAKVIGAHFQYLKRATEEGKVLLAGPATDPPAIGIVVFEAPDRAAAEAFMKGDPAVQAGVFKAELKSFRAALIRSRP